MPNDHSFENTVKNLLKMKPKPHKPAKGIEAGDRARRETPGEHGLKPPVEGGKPVTDDY